MKIMMLSLFACLCTFQLYAQQTAFEIAGVVADYETGQPVQGAIVAVYSKADKIVGYTSTNTSGEFVLPVKSGSPEIACLRISMMGYKEQQIESKNLSEKLLIMLTPQALNLKAVYVKAPPVSVRRDTVVYDVAAFAGKQDKTIADVLRKMPGIQVEESGQIKYNGEPINKFYIEGVDMLDSKYGLATNNISQKDVKSVEVLENHQPVKALKKTVFSDRAAINIKLKEEAKAKWVGTLAGGLGGAPFLWNANLFAMRIGAKTQSMAMLKADNTGKNPGRELNSFSIEEVVSGMDNFFSLDEMISVGTSQAPLNENRTRFNNTYMANATNTRKLSEDYQLNTQVDYLYDKLTSDYASRTSYYLNDTTLLMDVNEQADFRKHWLSARSMLTANTDRFYLKNKLSADFKWREGETAQAGTYPNAQLGNMDACKIANDFQWVKTVGNGSFTISSSNQYVSVPQNLTVLREDNGTNNGEMSTARQFQDIKSSAFYSNTLLNYGVNVRYFKVNVKGGAHVIANWFSSGLDGIKGLDGVNDNAHGFFKGYLSPSIVYEKGKIRASAGATAAWYHYWFKNKLNGEKIPDNQWNGTLSGGIKYRITPKFSASLSGLISRPAVNDRLFYTGAVLRNSRYISQGMVDYNTGVTKNISGAVEYKDPLNTFFVKGSVSRSWNQSPLTGQQFFVGDYIVNSFTACPANSSTWSTSGNISKGIDAVRGKIAVDISYVNTDAVMEQNGELSPYSSSSLQLSPSFNFRIGKWAEAEYKLTYVRSTLALEREEETSQNRFNQVLSINLSLLKKLKINLTGEHYYTRLSNDQTKNLFLADAALTYSIHYRYEISGSVTNLLNQTAYTYTIFNELSSVAANYAIRGRNFLLGFYIKF